MNFFTVTAVNGTNHDMRDIDVDVRTVKEYEEDKSMRGDGIAVTVSYVCNVAPFC